MKDLTATLAIVARMGREPWFDPRGVDRYRLAYAVGYVARLHYLTEAEDS